MAPGGVLRRDIDQDAELRLQSSPEATAVHDRIRTWQAQNTYEAVDLDALSFKSRPRSAIVCTPDLSRASSPITREPQTTPRNRNAKWVQQDNKQWTKQRRSLRNSQEKVDLHTYDTTDMHTDAQNNYTHHDLPQSTCTRTESTHARNVTSSRAEREERRKRRREARTKASGDDTFHQPQRPLSDTTPYYDERFDKYDQGHRRDANISHDPHPAAQPEPALDSSPHSFHSDMEDVQTHQPSKYAQTLGKGTNSLDSLQPPRGRKLTILNKTMGMLGGRSDAPRPPSNRIPSIEAWLEEQPGPSFEHDNQVVASSERSNPSKKPSRRKKISIEPTIVEVDDPNRIWDSVATSKQAQTIPDKPSFEPRPKISSAPSETTRSKKRLFSLAVPQDSSKGAKEIVPPLRPAEKELQTAPDLQRRGANARRTRSYNIAGDIEAQVPLTDRFSSPVATDKRQPTSLQSNSELDHRPKSTKSDKTAHVDSTATGLEYPQTSSLKRKLTHEDLISILSQPRLRKSTKSVRNARSAPNTPQQSVVSELLENMRNEEPKYNQELRTLVDGVTPVLLQSLLSKSDPQATPGLFSNDENQDANFTKPIIQMGIALERLKTLHSRIPLKESEIDSLLSWATSAQKHYHDYIRWYRLGFHGILVNLAPLGPSRTTEEEIRARDLDGDVTSLDGQRVDVAYLQKRPLVRLKKISKLITAVRDEQPTNEKASKLAHVYLDLIGQAKQRHNEEQARLEDEAAANLDITRTRDIRTMGPMTSVQIDKNRKVRARDCFEMTLYHSTGQRMDCPIEIIIRDDPQPGGIGGDILICQIEEESKWLLFAPITMNNVSARRDESTLDIVLMIRGVTGISENWHELVALKANSPDAVVEWVQMLGSSPLPPKICQVPAILQPAPVEDVSKQMTQVNSLPQSSYVPLSAAALASLPSDIDVPIGEPSVLGLATANQGKANTASLKSKAIPPAGPKLNLGGGLQKKEIPDLSLRMKSAATSERYSPPPTSTQPQTTKANLTAEVLPHHTRSSERAQPSISRDSNLKRETVPSSSRNLTEKQRQVDPSPQTAATSRPSVSWASELATPIGSDLSSLRNGVRDSRASLLASDVSSQQLSHVSDHSARDTKPAKPALKHMMKNQQTEKVAYPKDEKTNMFKTSTSLTESIREQWAVFSGYNSKRPDVQMQKENPSTPIDQARSARSSAHSKPSGAITEPRAIDLRNDLPPAPPPHREKFRDSIHLTSPFLSGDLHSGSEFKRDITSNNNVYQDYESSSDTSFTDSDKDGETSDTSEEDYGSEIKDLPTPLVNLVHIEKRGFQPSPKALPSLPVSGPGSLQPSDSASNAPYRRAPSPSAYTADKKRRTVATVCSWSDHGVWQPIYEGECLILISPGLVQALKIVSEFSPPAIGPGREDEEPGATEDQLPLVEFELTPIVPLRKGTALDITIRSPPTPRSTVRTTNNVMFRSKTTQDCDKLYHLINWARCNNPTYAQLARSRARQEPLTFNPNATVTKTKSWFSFGSHQKSSYRASSQPPPSMADTGMSGNSAFSAFSALKKFGQNSPFSLKRSSVIRKSGVSVMGESLYSSSNGTGSGSGTSTPAPSQAGYMPGANGPNVPPTSAEAAGGGGMVNNMKIHLFLRQGQKWEQLGQCYLTVLPAVKSPQAVEGLNNMFASQPVSQTPRSSSATGLSGLANPRARHYRLPSSSHTPHQIHGDGREKRILITSVKDKERVMMDEVLGETCFEKIMQTGIAINVWKEEEAVQDRGGVLTGRSRTYMVQFKTSMEASWVFNMCGVYRYGAASGS